MITSINRYLGVLLFVLIHPFVLAQGYTPNIQKIEIDASLDPFVFDYRFQYLDGVVWIATSFGLYRYDGTSLKMYTKEKHGLCHNTIHTIGKDEFGNIIVAGADYGNVYNFCVFDPISETFCSLEEYTNAPYPFDIKNTLISQGNYINSIFFLESIKNNKDICYELKNKRLTKILSIDNKITGWETGYVNDIFRDVGDGYQSFVHKNVNDSLKTSLVYLDAAGQPIGTGGCNNSEEYIFHYMQKGDTTMYSCMEYLPNNQYRVYYKTVYDETASLVLSNSETLRFYNHKLYVLGNEGLKIYTQKGKLLESFELPFEIENRLGFWVDEQENVWLFHNEHLYIISLVETPFQVELNNHKPPYKMRGITQLDNGEVYVTGANLLLHKFLDSTNWESSGHHYYINNLGLLAEEDTLWIASEQGVLLKYNTRNKDFVPILKSEYNLVWEPYQTANKNIWIGTSRGLYRLDRNKKVFKHFRYSEDFPTLENSVVYNFYTNTKGTWLATSTGLYLVDLAAEKTIAHYNNKQAAPYYLPFEHVLHVYEDASGIFWLATKGSGLVSWDPTTKKTEQFTKENKGFSSNVIYAVYADDFNNLWLPTDKGLMCFNKQTKAVKIYKEEDGLPHKEFNTISHYQNKDGRLFLGTQNGMIHFHPKDLQKKDIQQPFIISSCIKIEQGTDSVFRQTEELLATHQLSLTPNDKFIELDFALLDYKNLKGNQYSYKLEGYDDKWTYQATSSIRISSLPYGTYILLLRAKASGNTNWQDYPYPITIYVTKPFYLQTWFLILVVFFLIGLIYLIVRSRTQRLIQRQRELEDLVTERTAQIEEDKKLIEGQAEELRALDKVKSKFFANISHELRTPLTLILGPLSYILDQPDKWEEATVREQLTVIQRNGKSLMQLIEEILDLSKLEASKLELLEESTQLNLFFEDTFNAFIPQLDSLGIAYQLQLKLSKSPMYALVDRKKMEKVVNNFLSNAIKFTKKGGEVCLSIQDTEDTLRVVVSDTGKGIDPNDLPHVFERFYQSKNADQELYGGTGIGLALVSEFAKLMGGKTYVKSQLSKGSQFYFEFPKKEVERQRLVIGQVKEEILENEPIESIGTDFTVLVVEDNLDMRNFIAKVLQERYQKVLLAQNGLEGIALLEKHNTDIHLIVSDIMMPEMDGLTMLKQIKEHTEWHKIPMVMLTALATERDKLNALTIGVDDYLTKPFSVTELLVRTQNLLYNYHQRKSWQEIISKENKDPSEASTKPSVEPSKVDSPKQEKVVSELDREWIKTIENKVLENLEDGIPSVEELAQSNFIGARQLTRRIKKITGLTPAKFLREIQLQAARKSLEDGKWVSVSDLAYQFGFKQLSTFSALFKKRFGKNPSEYRGGII
ncbi:MAG: response regulator [Aureispira sp.]|nr:response regulator [Aureispira sp.]